MEDSNHDTPSEEAISTQFTDCPLCFGSKSSPYLAARDYFYGVPGVFHIVRCQSCRHLFMNPRPTAESLRQCYPDHYSLHVETAVANPQPSESPPSETVRPWYARPPFRWIPGLRAIYRFLTTTHATMIPIAPTTEKKALELGCGVGSFLDELRERGWTPDGVEFSQHATDLANCRGHHVRCLPIEDAEFPANCFDAVFAWMVIEHLQSPRSVIQQTFRWLKPQGHICISVPNAATFQTWIFGRYWFPYDLPRHLQHFTSKSISSLLVEEGFNTPKVIHQRSVRSWYASIGAAILDRFPDSKLGNKLIKWTNDTPFWLTLAVSPIALLLAWLRQSDRITIIAEKPTTPPIE